MERCVLLSPDNPSADACTLRVAWDSASPGGVVISAEAAERLGSVHRTSLSVDIWSKRAQRERLEAGNSFLSAEESAALDPSGVIPLGAQVSAGQALVSLVAPTAGEDERLADASLRAPPGWDGAVVREVLRFNRQQLGDDAPHDLQQRIQVDLEVQRRLAVGDVLLSEDVPLGAVARIEPGELREEGCDLRAGGPAVQRLLGDQTAASLAVSKSAELAADSTRARVSGPRSLITRQPLKRFDNGLDDGLSSLPQRVTCPQVRWLRERGLNAVLQELVSFKSDDRAGVVALRELSAVRDTTQIELPRPHPPTSLYLLHAHLAGLGLRAEFQQSAPHEPLTARLRPATAEDVLALSAGSIRKPETLNYRTGKGEREGLCCPQVFGDDQYRFGHYELPTPVVPYYWRHGAPSTLTRLLEAPGENIEKLVYYAARVRVTDDEVQWEETGESEEGWLSGAEAVAALLERPSVRRQLPPGLKPAALTLHLLPVIPLPVRPIILLDSGNYATSDLNDLYRRVINRGNRLRKLVELGAPSVILLNERRQLQQSVDQLLANTQQPGRKVEQGDRPLVDMLNMLGHRLALESKLVDWCGAAHAASDGGLSPGEMVVPAEMFERLRLSPERPWLVSSGEAFIAAMPRPDGALLVRLSPADYQRLQLAERPAPRCELHVPIGSAAVAEAEQLMRQAPDPVCQVPDTWLGDAKDWIAALAEAALRQRPLSLASPAGLLNAGLAAPALDERWGGRPG